MTETEANTLIVFEVPWAITGKTEIVAASKAEANQKFYALHLRQIVEDGELESGEPEYKIED